jgi:hypothetical protein
MAFSLLGSNQAQAQCGVAGGYGFGYGYDVGRLYSVLADKVPYYAAFPPVYYSAPVPRTYGYSPFAYPPGTMTPELAAPVEPQEIINPHVEATSAEEPQAGRVTQAEHSTRALVITNPYVGKMLAGANKSAAR